MLRALESYLKFVVHPHMGETVDAYRELAAREKDYLRMSLQAPVSEARRIALYSLLTVCAMFVATILFASGFVIAIATMFPSITAIEILLGGALAFALGALALLLRVRISYQEIGESVSDLTEHFFQNDLAPSQGALGAIPFDDVRVPERFSNDGVLHSESDAPQINTDPTQEDPWTRRSIIQ
ncbi:MAG: hypothetical protein IT290_12155 [Deltaproteobacteria bacterium]|nr:hypothetical protein [Deltaproteobacteria bacterium]